MCIYVLYFVCRKYFVFFAVITDKSDTDKCIDTSSFLLPPSRYQLQNVNESILSPANAKSTHEAIRGSVDIMESNMLGNYICGVHS